jgi:hypothetical protein
LTVISEKIMTNANTFQLESQMDRFGLKLASHLDDLPLGHDVSERLRSARQQALAQRKIAVQTATAQQVSRSGPTAVLGGDGLNWFNRFVGALPIVALAVGLVAINISLDDERANELAEVDMQLLTDDLPPSAHIDPGFAQYLKFGPPALTNSQAR